METIGANNEAMSRIKRGRLPGQRKQGVNNKTASIDLFIRPVAGGSQGPGRRFQHCRKAGFQGDVGAFCPVYDSGPILNFSEHDHSKRNRSVFNCL